jgi:hypothetical protein
MTTGSTQWTDGARTLTPSRPNFGASRFAPIPLDLHRQHARHMTDSLRTDLNDFLFSPIANDENGMHLTMLSALARSGVDPWDEAASLAALSQESATQKIIQMLAGVPNGPSPGDQTASLAARLVTKLHLPPNPMLKQASLTGTKSQGDELPRLSLSALPARVRWTIYLLGGLFLVVMIYRTLIGS